MISKTIGCRGLAYFQTNPCGMGQKMGQHLNSLRERDEPPYFFKAILTFLGPQNECII